MDVLNDGKSEKSQIWRHEDYGFLPDFWSDNATKVGYGDVISACRLKHMVTDAMMSRIFLYYTQSVYLVKPER